MTFDANSDRLAAARRTSDLCARIMLRFRPQRHACHRPSIAWGGINSREVAPSSRGSNCPSNLIGHDHPTTDRASTSSSNTPVTMLAKLSVTVSPSRSSTSLKGWRSRRRGGWRASRSRAALRICSLRIASSSSSCCAPPRAARRALRDPSALSTAPGFALSKDAGDLRHILRSPSA